MTFVTDITGYPSMTPARYVDKRAAKLPTSAEIAARDDERKNKRAEVKQQIAAAQLADLRRLEIVAAIETINEKKEVLAAAHVKTCTPIQRQLSQLEAQQIAKITNREAVDESAEDRRRELLDQLRSANADLEEKIGREDRLLAALEIDRVAVAKQCTTSLLESELIQLGRSDLKIRLKVATSGRTWCESRLSVSEDKAAKFPGEQEFLQAEIAAAASEVARMKELEERALRQIIEE